ncbi:MAG: alanine racemase [Rickettsiales bacterium]
MSAFLSISLSAIIANWQLLQARHKKNHSAAVVKADAYGLGMLPVAQALYEAGCKTFFVATLEEGMELRKKLPNVPIYIFHGVGRNEEKEFLSHHLRPVLNSPEQIARWQGKDMPAALHIDTGMNRLGLSETELNAIDVPAVIRDCRIELVMSHLVSASEPDNPLNKEQRRRFDAAIARFPNIPASLANSSGHFLSEDFHYDLGRPGCSLYGITPNSSLPNPMMQVATLSAPIIQIRHIDKDGTIGYSATAPVKKGMRTITVAMGYADGIQRLASNKLSAWLGDYECRMLGRVSMDMTCYDVSHIPPADLEKAESVTLIDAHQTVDDVAKICDTIGYEIFTRMGNRVRRLYS